MNEAIVVHEKFPRPLLVALGAILALTVIAAAGVGLTDSRETFVTHAAATVSQPLNFVDRSDGGIDVIDPRDGHAIAEVAPGTNGFLRGALRGLARERKRRDIGARPPFVLTARTDGRLTLDDPATGRQVDLASFGATNLATFRQFLPQTSATMTAAGSVTPPNPAR
jgi:putative photosynthetic complex assembly protein